MWLFQGLNDVIVFGWKEQRFRVGCLNTGWIVEKEPVWFDISGTVVFFNLCWQNDVKLRKQLYFERKTTNSRAGRAII